MSRPNVKARRKRLLVLADFLEGTVLPMLDGAKFDMGTWGQWRRDKGEPKELDQVSGCGFAGCAIGWGYYSPELRRSGIRRYIHTDECSCHWCEQRNTNSRDVKDAELQAFFGLDDQEFSEAFLVTSDYGRRGIRRVAKRLRKIAAAEPRQESEAAP